MSAYMRKHTSKRHIFAVASTASSANCQNIHHLFIFIHCTPYLLIHSFILPFSPFSSAYPFDGSFPSWLLLLLFISSLPFIIGEPESTMINEVLRAVCKLCMFQMIQPARAKAKNAFQWLAGWLGVLTMMAYTLAYRHAHVHGVRRKRSHKTNQDLQATLHKLRFSKTR